MIAGFFAQIEDAKERLEASKPTLSTAAKVYYRAELDADDVDRLIGPDTEAWNLPGEAVDTLPGYAEYLRHVAAGRITGEDAEMLIGHAADKLRAKGMLPEGPRVELLRTYLGKPRLGFAC